MGGFPALMIKSPESPLQQFGQVEQIKSAMQQQQMAEIELQNARQQQVENQTIRQSFLASKGDMQATISAAAASGKVNPATLLKLQTGYTQQQQALATLNETQLKNASAAGDKFSGALDAVMKVPVEQRAGVLKNQLAGLAIQGMDVSKVMQTVQGLPDLSDETLKGVEASLIGHNKMLEQELEGRKTTATEQSAQGTLLRGQAMAAEVPGTIARNAAQTALATTENAQKGQITPVEQYKQNQENYRATLARAATNANAIGKQGLESLQKSSEAYSAFSATANTLKNSLTAAQNGNEMTAAVAPLMGTLFVTTAEGVKRINETELKGVTGAGSLAQRINGALGKMTGEGPLSSQLKEDMSKMVDLYIDAKYASYQKQAAYTQKLHGLDPATTPILDRDGSITTVGAPQAAAAKAPTRPKGVPEGAVWDEKSRTWSMP